MPPMPRLPVRASSPWRRPAWVLAMATALVLAACANPDKAAPGSTQAETQQRFGQPTLVFPALDGERWIYSRQPAGRQVYALDFDTQGQLRSARQVLTREEFARVELGRWTRDDVTQAFGPPAEIGRVASHDGEVWTYYWENPFYMLFHIYLDPQGVVRDAHEQMEILPSFDHSDDGGGGTKD